MLYRLYRGIHYECINDFLEAKIMPYATRISGQHHMSAIRHGIIATLPLTIVGSSVMTTVSYIFLKLNLIPMMVAKLPFTVLSPIAALISTDWTIMAAILVIINFVISLLIYYPFFKVFEKQQLERELEAITETSEE